MVLGKSQMSSGDGSHRAPVVKLPAHILCAAGWLVPREKFAQGHNTVAVCPRSVSGHTAEKPPVDVPTSEVQPSKSQSQICHHHGYTNPHTFVTTLQYCWSHEPNLAMFAKLKLIIGYASATALFKTSPSDITSTSLPPLGLSNVIRAVFSPSELEGMQQEQK